MAEKFLLPMPPLTYRDYCELPDDGTRYEIIEGELFMTPSPSYTHQKVSRNIQFILMKYLEIKKTGEILSAPFDVILEDTTVVQPDLIYISSLHRDRLTEKGITGPPDLIVEILSPSTSSRDRILKNRSYAKLGVPWYWIVDPSEKKIDEFHLEDGLYCCIESAMGEGIFESNLFSDLSVELKDVWSL